MNVTKRQVFGFIGFILSTALFVGLVTASVFNIFGVLVAIAIFLAFIWAFGYSAHLMSGD